ncbi:MAG: hypothetical protein KBC43_01210 [Bacteroidales bacterium]|nr:hypothetical protein [Bacteroidales bacterium]
MFKFNSWTFKTLVFLLLLFGLDRITGFCLARLYHTSNYYDYAKLRYTLDSTDQDILIFGSSRAVNQFDSRIISKKTGMSTYNCGFGGQGLQFSYIQMAETFKRYTPKIIILDISPNILLDPKSNDKLKILLPYFKKDTLIYNALTGNDYKEKLKFISAIFPYNSTILYMLRKFHEDFNDSLKGFIPIHRMLDTANLSVQIDKQFPGSVITEANFTHLDQIINLCKSNDVQLVVVICPIYRLNENLKKHTGHIKDHINQNFKEIQLMDYSQHPMFLHEEKLFSDNLHLNYEGAKMFSEVFSEELDYFNHNLTQNTQ